MLLRACLLAFVVMGGLYFAPGAGPIRTPGPKPGFPLELEERKLYHGVFAGDQDQPELFNPKYLKNYTGVIKPGRKLAWVYFSNEWDVAPTFPKDACKAIHDQGATPYIRLMLRKDPYAKDDKARQPKPGAKKLREDDPCKIKDQGKFTLNNINHGMFDEQLQQWGKAAAAWGHPLLLEWGTECNGCWFWWNGKHNGEKNGPAKFIRAYQRIIDQVRMGAGAEGAKKLIWVFHVNYESTPKDDWNQPECYFPGKDYTAWIGVSLYGSQEPRTDPPATFAEQFGPCHKRLLEKLPKLPILLSELGTTKTEGDKDANWVREALKEFKTGRWENVRGFAWWNDAFQRYEEPKGLVDFRVQSNRRVAEVIREFLKDACVGEPGQR
jgi:hypothetical protein